MTWKAFARAKPGQYFHALVVKTDILVESIRRTGYIVDISRLREAVTDTGHLFAGFSTINRQVSRWSLTCTSVLDKLSSLVAHTPPDALNSVQFRDAKSLLSPFSYNTHIHAFKGMRKNLLYPAVKPISHALSGSQWNTTTWSSTGQMTPIVLLVS